MVIKGAIRVLTGAVICAVVVGGCSTGVDKSGGEETVEPLVLTGINTRSSEEIQPFVDQIASLSNGSIRLDLESGWHRDSVDGETDAIEAVRAGSADFAVVPVRAWRAAGVTSFDALIAPMAVDSYALQDAVLQDDMVEEMLAGVEELGLIGIGILPGPMRKAAGISRNLLAPEDFQGARIAMSAGAVAERSLSELGATPVPSTFEGADISGFDGLEQQVASINGNQYDGVVTTVTANVNLWPRSYVVVGNAEVVDALSGEQRDLLLSAARQAVPATNLMHETAENDAVQQICHRARLTFAAATGDQVQQLRDAFSPVNDWLAEDEQTQGFLQRIQELRTDADAGSGPLPDCAASATTGSTDDPTTDASALDGRWEVSYTREEYAAAGADAGELEQPEIGGEFYLEFGAGRFTTGIVGDPRTNEGTFMVDGDTLTLDVETTNVLFTLLWSIYRETLTFERAPGGESPTHFIVKPWNRAG